MRLSVKLYWTPITVPTPCASREARSRSPVQRSARGSARGGRGVVALDENADGLAMALVLGDEVCQRSGECLHSTGAPSKDVVVRGLRDNGALAIACDACERNAYFEAKAVGDANGYLPGIPT